MNLGQHPELLDRLAASYALGTLRGGARRRFETLARENPRVRAAALLWQARWSALPELERPVQPDAAVWVRIHNMVQAEQAQASPKQAAAQQRTGGFRSSALAWWRSAAVLGACATVAAVAVGL